MCDNMKTAVQTRQHPHSQTTAGAVANSQVHSTTASGERTSMNLINEEYRIYSIGTEYIPERYSGRMIILYYPKRDMIIVNESNLPYESYSEISAAYLSLDNWSRKVAKDNCPDNRSGRDIHEVLCVLDRASRIRRRLRRNSAE